MPPLPIDMPVESIEIIWLYAQMPEPKQKQLHSFIRENLKFHNMNLNNEKGSEEEHKVDLKADKGITQYTDLMKQMLETLIAQACEMAGFV